MRHTITLDDMLAWIDAEGGREHTYAQCATKRLGIKLGGGYRVTMRSMAGAEKVVYEGTDGKSAVDAYNAAP